MTQGKKQCGQGVDVKYVANLARMDLSGDEADAFQRQLARVVEYFRELQELDLTGVEPMAHAAVIENVFRADVPRESLPRDEVLRNAPQANADLFVVPKIVE